VAVRAEKTPEREKEGEEEEEEFPFIIIPENSENFFLRLQAEIQARASATLGGTSLEEGVETKGAEAPVRVLQASIQARASAALLVAALVTAAGAVEAAATRRRAAAVRVFRILLNSFDLRSEERRASRHASSSCWFDAGRGREREEGSARREEKRLENDQAERERSLEIKNSKKS